MGVTLELGVGAGDGDGELDALDDAVGVGDGLGEGVGEGDSVLGLTSLPAAWALGALRVILTRVRASTSTDS